jgi:hypothetical protein
LKTRSEPTQREEKPRSQNNPVLQNKAMPHNFESVEWFFADYKNEDVIAVCDKFIELMKSSVNEFRKSYP